MKVLLTDHPWPGVEIEERTLSQAGLSLIEAPPGAGETEFLRLADGIAAIMTCWAPVSRLLVNQSPLLRIIARLGVGLDNIDLTAAADAGVMVTNVPDYCVEEVSDHVVAFVLSWARGIVKYDRDVRAGNWRPLKVSLRRVSALSIGIIGLGRIGRRTADKFLALGCTVIGSSGGDGDAMDNVEIVPLEELARRADVVTVHVPMLPSTQHLIDAAFLARMRPGSLLVNVSRGGIVDTAAVADALRHGHLDGAAFDVLEGEPAIPHEIRGSRNTIVTPHVGFSSDLSVIELRERAATQVVDALTGGQPRDQVPVGGSRTIVDMRDKPS